MPFKVDFKKHTDNKNQKWLIVSCIEVDEDGNFTGTYLREKALIDPKEAIAFTLDIGSMSGEWAQASKMVSRMVNLVSSPEKVAEL